MIHIYCRVMHIKIEKVIIGNTQPAHDVSETSPEGSLNVLTSRTYKGPSGESEGTNAKIGDFMGKLFFRSNSSFITYLFLFYTGRTNLQKL